LVSPTVFLDAACLKIFGVLFYDMSVLLQQDFLEFLGVAEKSSKFFHRKEGDPFVATGTDFIESSQTSDNKIHIFYS